MELEAGVVCEAVDKLIKGQKPREVFKFLYSKATENDQLITSYFCYMIFRLASLHLEEADEAKVFAQIISMSEVHESRLLHGF